jgi:hypothetical protein
MPVNGVHVIACYSFAITPKFQILRTDAICYNMLFKSLLQLMAITSQNIVKWFGNLFRVKHILSQLKISKTVFCVVQPVSSTILCT